MHPCLIPVFLPLKVTAPSRDIFSAQAAMIGTIRTSKGPDQDRLNTTGTKFPTETKMVSPHKLRTVSMTRNFDN
jgi:hypothetical protein